MEAFQLNSLSVRDHFILKESPDHSFPLNLKVRVKSKEDKIEGPLLYFIKHNGFVVYVGSYKEGKKDVRIDRWDKHIQTLTNRGTRVGYQSKASQKIILSESAEKAFGNSFQESVSSRFRDTGCVSNPRKLEFAMKNVDAFSRVNNIYGLEIKYLKLDSTSIMPIKDLERIMVAGFRVLHEKYGYPEITNVNLVKHRLTEEEREEFNYHLNQLTFGEKYLNVRL